MGMRLRHRNPVVPGTPTAPAPAWAGRHWDVPCLASRPGISTTTHKLGGS